LSIFRQLYLSIYLYSTGWYKSLSVTMALYLVWHNKREEENDSNYFSLSFSFSLSVHVFNSPSLYVSSSCPCLYCSFDATSIFFLFFSLFTTPILLLFFDRQYIHLANIRLKKNDVLWWWHAHKGINTYIHICMYMRERKSRRPDDWLYIDVQAHYLCSVYLSKSKKLFLYRREAKGQRERNKRHFTC